MNFFKDRKGRGGTGGGGGDGGGNDGKSCLHCSRRKQFWSVLDIFAK